MTKARRQQQSTNNRRMETWRIVVWSGVSNLLLLSVFLGGEHLNLTKFLAAGSSFGDADVWIINPTNGEPARGSEPLFSAAPKADFSRSTVTVAKSEQDFVDMRADRETLPEEAIKSSMVTVAKSEPEIDLRADRNAVPEEANKPSTADLVLAGGASIDDSEAVSAKPILRKNPQSGRLEIGNFKSLSLVGTPQDCVEFGNSLLNDAGSSSDKIDVLTSVDEITIARICATNGSVIITCRSGQISVSPRRPRPDDRCARNG